MRRIAAWGAAAVMAALVAPAAFGETPEAHPEKAHRDYGVLWYETLESAVAKAAAQGARAKPIAWFRVVGERDGLT
jgi:hypothetical protein